MAVEPRSVAAGTVRGMVQRSGVTVTWEGIEGAEPLEFAYLEDGPADGPLALCLHGFPDHAPTWTALLGDLAAAGFHAVAPWTRGYAPTAVPADGLYQTAALSLDALGYYRHLLNPAGHDPRLAAVEAAAAGWVPVPTLYLHGADDGCIGADIVAPDEMKTLFPAGLEAEILPGLGHFLHLEDPATVNGRIVEFLAADS